MMRHVERAGSDDDVSGVADFRSASGKSRFKVKIKHAAPNDTLDIVVGGVVRGAITVAAGEREIEFAAEPLNNGKTLPTGVDPVCAIRSVDVTGADGTVVLQGGF